MAEEDSDKTKTQDSSDSPDTTKETDKKDDSGKKDDSSNTTDAKTSDTPSDNVKQTVADKDSGWATLNENMIAQSLGLKDLDGVMGGTKAMKLRQHLLDPTNYKKEIKKPNPGKMPNNQDPYPVDLKIEEFETHYPPTHIHKLKVPRTSLIAAEAAMNVGTNADKRLAKLENNFCTLLRLFFRLGTRVPINCVYYGGQTPFEKYKGIRCLCDDRVSDGQEIQIDQCLYCTRFEPVYGKLIILFFLVNSK